MGIVTIGPMVIPVNDFHADNLSVVLRIGLSNHFLQCIKARNYFRKARIRELIECVVFLSEWSMILHVIDLTKRDTLTNL